jgi:hypothetical protein
VRATASDGRSLRVRFKEPNGLRVWETGGVRTAVSAVTTRRAVQMLCEIGGDISYVAWSPDRWIESVVVRLDPRLAPYVRDHPLVNYVVPEPRPASIVD